MTIITKILATCVALEFLYIMYLETFATISVLILLAIFLYASKIAVIILMAYIVLVALYGSLTSNPKIIIMQGGLAILTLISCIF